MEEHVVFTSTPEGQFLYDIAFVDLTDTWIARKHKLPISEVRKLRKLPEVRKLRHKVKKDRGER